MSERQAECGRGRWKLPTGEQVLARSYCSKINLGGVALGRRVEQAFSPSRRR